MVLQTPVWVSAASRERSCIQFHCTWQQAVVSCDILAQISLRRILAAECCQSLSRFPAPIHCRPTMPLVGMWCVCGVAPRQERHSRPYLLISISSGKQAEPRFPLEPQRLTGWQAELGDERNTAMIKASPNPIASAVPTGTGDSAGSSSRIGKPFLSRHSDSAAVWLKLFT
jgi:hypothetical protein